MRLVSSGVGCERGAVAPTSEPPEKRHEEVTALVASRAGEEVAGALNADRLAPYTRALLAVVRSGGRIRDDDLLVSESIGRQAALDGVSLATLVDGYLSASRIVWSEHVDPGRGTHGEGHAALIRAGEAVFQALDAQGRAAGPAGGVTAGLG